MVFRARNDPYRNVFAVKLFGLDSSANWEAGLDEAKKQASVQHKTVVRVQTPALEKIEFKGEIHTVLCVPMDFATLGACDKHPPFASGEELVLEDFLSMIELLDGLKAIHDAGIIHHDIKPGNILRFEDRLGGEPTIALRIADFGMATMLAAVGLGSGKVGFTPQFMAPEQIHSQLSAASDVYSMGATLYYMVTKKLPIVPIQENPSIDDWVTAHQESARPNARTSAFWCPPRLALLIMQMMDIKEEQRPTLEQCIETIKKIIHVRGRRHLADFPIPEPLDKQLEDGSFPVRYRCTEFDRIFKPQVHRECGYRLHLVRIEMPHPVFKQYRRLIELLIQRFSDTFQLYETWGTFDVHIMLWTTPNLMSELEESLTRNFHGAHISVVIAEHLHYLYSIDDLAPTGAIEPVIALAVQEDIILPGIDSSQYICDAFPEEFPKNSVRAFTYVETMSRSAAEFRGPIAKSVLALMSGLSAEDQRRPEGTRHFHKMSVIEVDHGSSNSIACVVDYVGSAYRYLNRIPTILTSVGENAIRTSTFLETRRVVIQSDKMLLD